MCTSRGGRIDIVSSLAARGRITGGGERGGREGREGGRREHVDANSYSTGKKETEWGKKFPGRCDLGEDANADWIAGTNCERHDEQKYRRHGT